MNQYKILKSALSLLPICLLMMVGCTWNKDKDDAILGEWNAHWETLPDESLPGLNGKDLQMNGAMIFKESGEVEISAFGFEGCIFSDDTMTNTLNWHVADSVLRFIDDGDDHGLPYKISKFTKNEIHLVLLEDINLILSRN